MMFRYGIKPRAAALVRILRGGRRSKLSATIRRSPRLLVREVYLEELARPDEAG